MNALGSYYQNTQEPWGQLFYQSVWRQLPAWQSMRILDFGSGFGITADHLAACNQVVAVEPNEAMCAMRIQNHPYRQITGGLEQLTRFPPDFFDAVLCHNVLEYVDGKEPCLQAFSRILRRHGILSLVKHHKPGRIMQRVLFENNPELAARELEGQTTAAQNFGEIRYYEEADLLKWADCYHFRLDNTLGVRIFFGLVQNNAIKYDPVWQEQMLALEGKTAGLDAFRNIAFFHHVLLSKQ